MKTKRCLTLTIIAAAAVIFTGCTRGVTADITSSFTPEQVSGRTVDDKFVLSQLDFSLRLFNESLKENGGNVLLSPLSLTYALALTANGADGITLSEIEAAVGEIPVSELNEYLYSCRSVFSEAEGFKLRSANSLWLKDDERISFKNEFLQTDVNYLGAEIYKADFDFSTVGDINGWVKSRTDGMIDRAINKINPNDVLYLINALAFDSEWEKGYGKSDVREGIFTSENGEEQTAEMMYSEESVYLEDENAVGFIKNYKGGKYAFAALLPKEGMTVDEYASSLSAESLKELLDNFEYHTVAAALPKFKYDCDFSLKDTLKSLGISRAFERLTSDFSKMAEMNDPDYKLYLNDVIQKTFIDVNEKGTRAGSVTYFNIGCTSAAPAEEKRVILDRPFVYLIIDNENHLPVFIGTLKNAA